MKPKIFLGLLFISVALRAEQNVYLIGADKNNKEVIYKTNVNSLQRSLSKTLAAQKTMALDVLEQNKDESSWKLSKFTLGLGVEGEAGIGPWNLGVAVKQRLVFEKVEGGN
ncbi:MAG: hypothetical protein NXH75_10575 [Halobacteriovoraceae bacterium]|nr:hypothetical protein [Halobacteriovoraceae bacterium]